MLVFEKGTRFKHDDFENVFIEITDHLGGEKCAIKWIGDKKTRQLSTLTTSSITRRWKIMVDGTPSNEVPTFSWGSDEEPVEVKPGEVAVFEDDMDIDKEIAKNFPIKTNQVSRDTYMMDFDDILDFVEEQIAKFPKLDTMKDKCKALYKLEFSKFRNLAREERAGFVAYLRRLEFPDDVIEAYCEYRDKKNNRR